MSDMTGKHVLITGATGGIGLETSVALAAMGAHVVMVGRNQTRISAAVDEVRRRANSRHVESLLCDFEVQAQIRQLASDYQATHDRLDVLINNAGTVYAQRQLTPDGLEATFAVNHLSYFLLTTLLLDLLERSAPARVVNVASQAHYDGTIDFDDLGYARGFATLKAYARSKLGNVLFTRELARRERGRGVTVNALHPGVVATGIWSHGFPSYARWLNPLVKLFTRFAMLTPAQGAETTVYLASSPEVEGRTGLYFDAKKERTPSALALDDALAAKLWSTSESLVGGQTLAVNREQNLA